MPYDASNFFFSPLQKQIVSVTWPGLTQGGEGNYIFPISVDNQEEFALNKLTCVECIFFLLQTI